MLLKEYRPGEPEPVFLWGDMLDPDLRAQYGLPRDLDFGQVGSIDHFALRTVDPLGKGYGALNLVPQAHCVVYGIYCRLSDEHLQILDDLPALARAREGVLYEREAVTVETVSDAEASWAWTYFIRGTVPERLSDGLNWKPGDFSRHQHPDWYL